MKAIVGFPGYWVDRVGHVYSGLVQRNRGGWATGFATTVADKPVRRMKPSVTHGYAHLTLWRHGKPFHRRVHLLVLETFHGPRPEGLVARHLNGRKSDNRAANLRWGTHKENADDREAHGHTRVAHISNRRLSSETVAEIRATARGRGVAIALAKRYGIRPGTVYGIWAGRKRKYG